MRGDFALPGGARRAGAGLRSIACLVFVVLLALAAWSGAMWLGRSVIEVAHLG